MDYKKVLVNFLPIVLVFLLVSYTREFAKFSHTILGKLFAVIIILFYAKLDKLSGLFVCILIIFYYQTDYIESFNNMLNTSETFENPGVFNVEEGRNVEGRNVEGRNVEGRNVEGRNMEDDFSRSLESVNDAYSLLDENENSNLYDKSKAKFRKTYCSNGHLINYGQVVKNDMAEHVYPEIKIKDDFHKCNVCDPSCDFTVIDRKITAENDLLKPKSSNEMFTTVWDNMRKSVEKLTLTI